MVGSTGCEIRGRKSNMMWQTLHPQRHYGYVFSLQSSA